MFYQMADLPRAKILAIQESTKIQIILVNQYQFWEIIIVALKMHKAEDRDRL